MEFHIFEKQNGSPLRPHWQMDTKDEDEAILKAEKHAETKEEGTTVGLYKQVFDDEPYVITGWTKMQSGKLRKEPSEHIESLFCLTKTDFDYGKMLPGDRKCFD